MDTSLSLLQRLAHQSDADAWQRLADAYTPLLHDWLRRYGVQPADADDLIQEVLTVAARELPNFQHNQRTGAFRNWLRTTLVHRLRDFWRGESRRPAASGGSDVLRQLDELADPHSALSQLWEQQHDEFVMRHLLQSTETKFAANTWRAFRRLVFDGAKPADVAAELEMTVNAVLIAKSRVLSHLRRESRGLADSAVP